MDLDDENKQLIELQEISLGLNPPTLLEYEIIGRPAFAHVQVTLSSGQEVAGEGGAMLWMDGTIKMETRLRGGCCASMKRSCCAGESIFFNIFTGPGKVALGQDLPGDMLPFLVDANTQWVFTTQAFVGGTTNCFVSAKWKGCCFCCCSGEGGFLTYVSSENGNPGICFATGYGMIERHDIPEGNTFLVDTGMFFAAPADTQPEITYPGTVWSLLMGGEGLVMRFTGPTTIFTQSHNPARFNAGGGGGAAAGAAAGAA